MTRGILFSISYLQPCCYYLDRHYPRDSYRLHNNSRNGRVLSNDSGGLLIQFTDGLSLETPFIWPSRHVTTSISLLKKGLRDVADVFIFTNQRTAQ